MFWNMAIAKVRCGLSIAAAKGKNFWYDPVFKVETIDGEIVWRHRHYRVKRAKKPGTFIFSVLDNGPLPAHVHIL